MLWALWRFRVPDNAFQLHLPMLPSYLQTGIVFLDLGNNGNVYCLPSQDTVFKTQMRLEQPLPDVTRNL